MKNCNKEESGKKRFLGLLSGRKEHAFFGKRYCEKCTGKSNARKEKQKGLIAKINANIIYVKGSCFETPLYDHVLGDKRIVIRTRYEKGEELRGGGGGEGEKGGMKG